MSKLKTPTLHIKIIIILNYIKEKSNEILLQKFKDLIVLSK